ncbi:FAD-dependent oxidoreductase [Acuticoccus mangrovi]|uniref:FAD-dependent oxidoreductase n=1 Tax=Acuticoccus mangrovi TaxID=2796142 RepID=A0A934IDT8_9HYPH|nr:FAD-dependent oxidoreductase [Acuticoccus mangrovi]MBJ3774724.1 FAD-dependent oxidoreductase [Acuticoccus mangrovi]
MHVVIAGAGHAALIALKRLGAPPAGTRITLVSRADVAHYSGMVPGWIEGIYDEAECSIPLPPLAAATGATFVRGDVVGADEAALHLRGGERIPYDLLVVNTGAVPRPIPSLDPAEVVPAKPFDRLITVLSFHFAAPDPAFVVVGGGIAGVEVAATLRARRPEAPVTLVEQRASLLPAAPRLGRRLGAALRARGVAVHIGTSVGVRAGRRVILADGEVVPADAVLTLTGASPAKWLDDTPFARAPDGFLAVDRRMVSTSHPNVIAVGDVATRPDDPRPKAGVFAVRQGPHLADAIAAFARGDAPPEVRLQRRALALVSLGHRRALFARNGIVAEGEWAFRLKDRLDRAFIAGLRTP